MSTPSYYARRYRTLYSPDALNFAARQTRPALAAVYSPAPTSIRCGLPKAAASASNPRIVLALLVPVAIATGIVTFFEGRARQAEQSALPGLAREAAETEAARKARLLDAYGERDSLEKLVEAMVVYDE